MISTPLFLTFLTFLLNFVNASPEFVLTYLNCIIEKVVC